jgi:cytochrome c oxidase cbb3-type subunit I/II
MLVGVLIATQLNFWQANFGQAWLSFGRLRPLHTNAVIFAFVGNMMFAGIYYSTQRLVKARLASDFLSALHFWGWQLIIVAAAITLPLGLTRGKEYAELIWPINIAVAVIWVVFAANFFWTLARRREKSLYVAIWFYIGRSSRGDALHRQPPLDPDQPLHSYPVFGGVQDGLVQWWYGHNAVAFFLTTPILGIMYYFLPKAAERPVYSYRLSVIHFWSLVFLYIWAGPHHLLNTSLPNWLQLLGMTFSLMLWAPSWGGMLNGLLTLRGAWHKLRTDPVLKFFAAAVTFYGMATFEGPLLSIKSVNALGHYTDWIIGHVHAGALGWNGFMAAGMFYWLLPRLWNKPLHSVPRQPPLLARDVGILLYVAAMWVSGITQGLMLNATDRQRHRPRVSQLPRHPQHHPAAHAPARGRRRPLRHRLHHYGLECLAEHPRRPGRQRLHGGLRRSPRPTARTIGVLGTFLNAPVLFITLILTASPACGCSAACSIARPLLAIMVAVLLAIGHFESRGKAWADWYDRCWSTPCRSPC